MSLPRALLARLVRSLVATSLAPLSPEGCGDIEVLRMLERVERAGRISALRSPNEFDHLLELGGAELGCDLFHPSLMQQQNSRDDIFGHAFSGGPTHIV